MKEFELFEIDQKDNPSPVISIRYKEKTYIFSSKRQTLSEFSSSSSNDFLIPIEIHHGMNKILEHLQKSLPEGVYREVEQKLFETFT